MNVTLNQGKDFEAECTRFIENGASQLAKETTDLIIKAHKENRVNEDAWQYFVDKCFHDQTPSFI